MSMVERYLEDIRVGKNAREELYRETRKEVLPILESWIPRELQNLWDAEDLLHETFLRAIDSLDRFEWRGENSWRNFVLTIAKHCIQDALKRKSRLDVRFAHESAVGGIRNSGVADRGPRSSGALSNQDTVEAILGRMRESDALLIRLKVLEGLADEEIAARLGKSVEATRKAFQRSMEKFTEVGNRVWQAEENHGEQKT